MQIEIFDDAAVQALQFVDNLFQRDNLERSRFFKNLPQLVPMFSKVFEISVVSDL